jgi:hypothetical protein
MILMYLINLSKRLRYKNVVSCCWPSDLESNWLHLKIFDYRWLHCIIFGSQVVTFIHFSNLEHLRKDMFAKEIFFNMFKDGILEQSWWLFREKKVQKFEGAQWIPLSSMRRQSENKVSNTVCVGPTLLDDNSRFSDSYTCVLMSSPCR